MSNPVKPKAAASLVIIRNIKNSVKFRYPVFFGSPNTGMYNGPLVNKTLGYKTGNIKAKVPHPIPYAIFGEVEVPFIRAKISFFSK